MSIESEYSLKELYDVLIKATSIIEVGDKVVEPGEVIAAFDKIELANFQEVKALVTAHGGFHDRARVFWDTTKELNLNFTQGIFSNSQLALMLNSKLIDSAEDEERLLSQRETLQADEYGQITLKYTPEEYLYVYDINTNQRITEYIAITSKTIGGLEWGTNYLVDYGHWYNKHFSTFKIGTALTNGFLTFEGKTRVKDDITGAPRTGVLFIPKLKLMSGLSMRLGTNASPVVGQLAAKAIPIGSNGNERAMELIFLDDDIDSDI